MKVFLVYLCKNVLKKKLSPDPTVINIDFEKAVINATKTIMRNQIKIQGCYYHLRQ